MKRATRDEVRFVRALIGTGAAPSEASGLYRAGRVALHRRDAARLASAGVVHLTAEHCSASNEAKGWLRRQLLAGGELAEQHRDEMRGRDGTRINLAESPLSRLAVAASGERSAFLERHQVEAGERVCRLADRAQLQPRVTMSYSGAHTAGRKGASRAAEISDMAAEARAELGRLHRILPRECADVVVDVCGFSKGLQTIETERGWPRQSAKLVLRIGLEQLAQHYGYAPAATGPETRSEHAWVGDGARPDRFE